LLAAMAASNEALNSKPERTENLDILPAPFEARPRAFIYARPLQSA